MLKSSVVKTVNFFLLAQKKYIRKQSTIECTRYASVRRILRNSTFLRQAAKCERAVCEQSIVLPAENRCNEEKPSITSNGVCWAYFCCVSGLFLRIIPPVCHLFFYAVLTYCALPITVTVRSRNKNEHVFSV